MIHLTYGVKDLEELCQITDTLKTDPRLLKASDNLFQLFTYSLDAGYINEMKKTILERIPQAKLIGCSTSGEMVDGQIYEKTTGLSVMLFEDCSNHQEQLAGNELVMVIRWL